MGTIGLQHQRVHFMHGVLVLVRGIYLSMIISVKVVDLSVLLNKQSIFATYEKNINLFAFSPLAGYGSAREENNHYSATEMR